MLKAPTLLSQQIINRFPGLNNSIFVRELIYALDNCLGCSQTAQEITIRILKTPENELTIKAIDEIKELQKSSYFYPDSAMKQFLKKHTGLFKD